MVVDAEGIGFADANTVFATQREEGKGHGVQGRAHVDDGIVVRLVYRLPHFSEIGQRGMTLGIAEGNDATDGRMTLEEGRYPLVEYEMEFCIGKAAVQRTEQGSSQDGIAHLTEADHEDSHIVYSL